MAKSFPNHSFNSAPTAKSFKYPASTSSPTSSIFSVIICLLVGVPLGLFSAYAGGAIDRIIGLIMDSVYAFPGLILAIAIAAMLGRGVVNMAISIAVVYVPSYFRVVRSQVLSIKES